MDVISRNKYEVIRNGASIQLNLKYHFVYKAHSTVVYSIITFPFHFSVQRPVRDGGVARGAVARSGLVAVGGARASAALGARREPHRRAGAARRRAA